MGVLFDTVHEGVTARAAAEAYGLEFGRNGRARCPWHADHKPDLAFYGDGARCYCHACHCGGDSIALTAQLFGLSALEAARKLNADFRIGADESNSAPSSEPSKAARQRDLKQWRNHRYSEVCEAEADARQRLEAMRAGWESPEFRAILKALALSQDELEMLHAANVEELKWIVGERIQ